MNKNILLASIVAVLASPLALARGHTQDIYGGVDMGAAGLGDQGAFCDTIKTSVATTPVIGSGDSANTISITLTPNQTAATNKPAFATGDCGDSETSVRVFAGYKVNDMISIEGFWLSSSGYATSHGGIIEFDRGNDNKKDITISFTSETDYTSFGLSAVGKYEVYDNLSLKGVLGLHSYSIEPSITPAGSPSPAFEANSGESDAMADFVQAKIDAREDSGVSLLYGVGAEYALGGNFNIRAGYDVLSSGDESVSYLSAGASYTYSF